MDNWLLLFIAVLNLLTATAVIWQGFLMRMLSIHTNSIKDALVASTAKASRAEGVVAGRAEEKGEEKADARNMKASRWAS